MLVTDWEAPTGPADPQFQPRTAQPTSIYRGYGDPHWRGQTCHVIASTTPGEMVIVLACGCRGNVPWWTLDPVAPE